MLKTELLLLTSQGWDIHLDLIKLYLSVGSKSRKFNTERIRQVFLIHLSFSPSHRLTLIFRLGSQFSFKHYESWAESVFFILLYQFSHTLQGAWETWQTLGRLNAPRIKGSSFISSKTYRLCFGCFFFSFSALNLSDSEPVWAGMNQPLALWLKLIMNNWPGLLVRHMLRMSD